jgi:hypothetical protein
MRDVTVDAVAKRAHVGGGCPLDAATRFTFRLHDVGPMVTGGLLVWSADLADEVLDTYHRLTESAPRELTAAALIRLAPAAPFVPEPARLKPIVAVLVCHSGTDAEPDLAPLRALPPPLVDLVREHSYTAQQSMIDDFDPPGLNQYWKTEFVPRLSPEYLDRWRDAALAVASPCPTRSCSTSRARATSATPTMGRSATEMPAS